jgi:hypothetical protein
VVPVTDGFAALDQQIERVRALEGMVDRAMPAIADVVESSVRETIARQVSPYGLPWKPTKSGKPALEGAAKAIAVSRSGKTVLVTLSGVEARHHLGWVRGGVSRKMIPDEGVLPAPMTKGDRRGADASVHANDGRCAVTDTLALPWLVQKVTDRFAAESTGATNVFGWKPVNRQAAKPRVCWVPGDDKNGDLGEIAPPQSPGRNPRPLGTLRELVTVYIEGWDTSAPEDETKQYEVTRFLFDAWFRAVYLAYKNQFLVKSAGWVNEKNERRRGAAIRVVLAVNAMIPDAAKQVAPADTHAEITQVLVTPPVGDDPGREETDDDSPDVVTPAS